MPRVERIKLIALVLFTAAASLMLLAGRLGERRVHAFSSGPLPGFTRAPGEDDCSDCHVPDGAPSGSISISAPQTYVPGQTYQLTVNVANADPSRRRWGFELTALDDSGNRAGTLAAGADGRTQVISGTLGTPARQYVEHTSAGTFEGQQNGASWTFNWTAPTENIGPVLFYAAGNQANGDGFTSGDSINFTFVAAQPASVAGDFNVTVTPSAQNIVPGASGSYTVTVTPAGGFTGGVALAVAGLPAGATATFNPATIQITDATARTSTLTVTNAASTPLGSFALSVTGQSGTLAHTGAGVLVTGPTMIEPNLAVRTIMSGLNQPTALAFIGPGAFFVLERATGRVVRHMEGALDGVVLDLPVNSNSERGLLGIALHPQFPANPRVYLYWTESTTGADSANVDDVPTLGNRVDSYLWNGTTLTFERTLIRLRSFQADEVTHRANHNGGVLRFGPDGKLYIIIGDQGRRGMLQNLQFGPSQSPTGPTVQDDQFGGPEPDDAHLTGVILRLNDDGTTPTDNPFFNAQTTLTGQAATNIKKVFAYGIRNGFGMDFDPLTGRLWNEENGDDAFDEINRVEAGTNGGWIQLMGPSSRVAEFKAIEVARGDSLQQARWPAHLLADTTADALARLFMLPGAHYAEPEFSWKFAVAPAGLGFARGRALGAQYEGDLFVGASRTTLANGFLFRFKLTSDRRAFAFTDARLTDKVADNADKFDLTESESLLAGRDFGVVTDIQTGPSGNLYAVSLSNGVVYEISAAHQSIINFSAPSYTSNESGSGLGHTTITVTRTGDTSATAAVDYATLDDAADVGCFDTVNNHGAAYARCDYATTLDTLTFAPGETQKTFTIPLIDDAYVEGSEAVALRLSNPTGAVLGPQNTATLTITDNDTGVGANPIFANAFFVRQQYLDFLSREPETDGLLAWQRVLEGCGDVNNVDPTSPSAGCDRITVSAAFFGSQEFRLKGFYVFLFYKAALNRLPAYAEIIPDMRSVTGATADEVFAKKAAFADAFAGRLEFRNLYDNLSNQAYVDALLARYDPAKITTPDPQQPDGTTFVTLTRADLVARLAAGTLTRAQVLRAVVQSREADAAEFNNAFVAMQYYGYLRRTPETAGYNNWLNYLNAHPNDFRTMVNGFMNSTEYRLRFGPPADVAPAYFVFDGPPQPETFVIKVSDPAKIAQARSLLGQRKIVTGIIIKRPAAYNRPWSFQLGSSSINFVDLAAEVCDANMSFVEAHLSEVGGSFLPGSRWCPWNARILREVSPSSAPASQTIRR